MRRARLSAIGVAALLVCVLGIPQYAHAAIAAPASLSGSVPQAGHAPASTGWDESSVRRHILDATNEARAEAGLPTVSADQALDDVAQTCSQTQAANDVMAHCTGFQTRYPPGWTAAAENVAFGYSVESVVDGWMNSPGHRANILRTDATHLGIGYAISSQGRPYYTQNFATYPNRPAEEATVSPTAAGAFVSVDPSRLLDTRSGVGAPRGSVSGFGSVDLPVLGRGGVPVSDVSAVVVNVTVVGAATGGFITVFPSGRVQPTASNVNFAGGQTIANLVTVKLGAGGKITVTNNSSGSVHLVADVAGYYLADAIS